MPDRPEAPREDQPEAVDEDRRRLLGAGLKLAGAAGAVVALDAMAPVVGMARAAANFRDRGNVNAANPGAPGTQPLVANALETPTPVSVSTPNATATVAELQKNLLQEQVEKARHENEWYWPPNLAAPIGIVGAFGTFVGLLFANRQASKNRRQQLESERDKRDEERFRKAVEGLDSHQEDTRVVAASMLCSLIKEEGHDQIYNPVAFNLAIKYLRERGIMAPLRSFDSALIRAFYYSYPLERKQLAVEYEKNEQRTTADSQLRYFHEALDASGVHLDYANLESADFRCGGMPNAFFTKAILSRADFRSANLRGAHFTDARLDGARFNGADLRDADLTRAVLGRADLSGVRNLEHIGSLKDANMHGVTGLSKRQIAFCKTKGASFDPPQPSNANN
jgi:hypothetical protein